MEPLLAELRNCIQDLEDMANTAEGISTSVGAHRIPTVSNVTDEVN